MGWRLRIRVFIGQVLDMIGAPGFVKECKYNAVVCPAQIQVRNCGYFTTVTVNGLAIDFDRLTGKINGVSYFPLCHTAEGVGLPIHLFASHAETESQLHTENTWVGTS